MNDFSTSPYLTLREALRHIAFISEAAPGRKFKVLVGPKLEPPIETQAIRGWLFAIPQIMNAGAVGDLHLKGYKPGSATLEDVPASAFVDAGLDPTTDRLEPNKPFPDSVTWTRLRFKREEVYELWPSFGEPTIELPVNDRSTTPLLAQEPESDAPPKSANNPAGWRIKVKGWYRDEYVPQHATNERPPNRDDNLEAARKKFPNWKIGRDYMRKLRKDHAPGDWTAQGRRNNK